MIESEFFFNYLPPEVKQRIISQCPIEATSVCKDFSIQVSPALKFLQWNVLKNDGGLSKDFRNTLVQIEKRLGKDKGDGRKLISAFFSSLTKPNDSKPLKELDFSNLGGAMLTAWKDDNLLKFWSRIDRHLNVDPPLKTAEEIRIWMSCENNRNTLTQIQELDLSKLKLTTLPDEIIHFTGLTRLDLSDNQLTKLPDTIGNLTALTGLYLSRNQLTKLPDTIGNLTTLTQLYLSGNKLTELPDTIKNLTALTGLNLSYNQLTKLPDTIGNFTALTELFLYNNQLTKLPDTIGNLTALTQLFLNDNKLTGLPDTIKNLTALTQLYLSRNQLTKLPDTIKNLTALTQLYLSGNKLTELPDTIKNLTALIQLHLNDNQLTKLPTTFDKIGQSTSSIPEVTLQGNILLVIPSCVLDKFKDNRDIKDFISSKERKCSSALDHLCQWIRKNSDTILNHPFTQTEALGKLVNALDDSDREELYFNIWKNAWGKNDGNLKWEEENRFNNMRLFISILGELLYKKQKN